MTIFLISKALRKSRYDENFPRSGVRILGVASVVARKGKKTKKKRVDVQRGMSEIWTDFNIASTFPPEKFVLHTNDLFPVRSVLREIADAELRLRKQKRRRRPGKCVE